MTISSGLLGGFCACSGWMRQQQQYQQTRFCRSIASYSRPSFISSRPGWCFATHQPTATRPCMQLGGQHHPQTYSLGMPLSRNTHSAA